jgi:hypothetical protein
MSDWRGWLLAGSAGLFILAAILVPAMPQPLSYHDFADCRTLWSVPNFFNVLSNLPFLAGGALGLALICKGGGQFIDQRERLPYLIFFLGALLTGFGSAYYHAAPDNTRLVWDRLPMTLGFAGLVAAAAERATRSWACARCFHHWRWAQHRPLLVCHRAHGAGKFIPYFAYQGWSILVIVLLIRFRTSHATVAPWCGQPWCGLAKFLRADPSRHRVLGGT